MASMGSAPVLFGHSGCLHDLSSLPTRLSPAFTLGFRRERHFWATIFCSEIRCVVNKLPQRRIPVVELVMSTRGHEAQAKHREFD
ncbi:hypothetical protein E4U13_006896, partial [Claviceps humidiphila]